jgi:hypothetical protein
MKRTGLIYYVCLLISILAMFLVFKGSAEAVYDFMKYYPLKEGVTWNYWQVYLPIEEYKMNYEVFSVGGTETIKGATCKKYWEFDSGELGNEPNHRGYCYACQAWTSNGLMLYKGLCQDGVGGYYFVCDPPLKLSPRWVSIGQTHTHSTNCTQYDPGGNVMGTLTVKPK